MSPVPQNEMLDELAIIAMDLQVALAEETNRNKKKELVLKSIEKIMKENKFAPIPEFEEGEMRENLSELLYNHKCLNIQYIMSYIRFQTSIGSTPAL